MIELERLAKERFFRGERGRLRGPDGSVLLLVAVLSALLSGSVILATTEMALDRRGARYVTDALRTFYIAESGLARAQAYLKSHRSASAPGYTEGCGGGEEAGACSGEGETPFDRWIPFGGGRYRVTAYDLSQEEAPYLQRDSGILVVSTGSLAENQNRRLCLLLDGPPDWNSLAWWEAQ